MGNKRWQKMRMQWKARCGPSVLVCPLISIKCRKEDFMTITDFLDKAIQIAHNWKAKGIWRPTREEEESIIRHHSRCTTNVRIKRVSLRLVRRWNEKKPATGTAKNIVREATPAVCCPRDVYSRKQSFCPPLSRRALLVPRVRALRLRVSRS